MGQVQGGGHVQAVQSGEPGLAALPPHCYQGHLSIHIQGMRCYNVLIGGLVVYCEVHTSYSLSWYTVFD